MEIKEKLFELYEKAREKKEEIKKLEKETIIKEILNEEINILNEIKNILTNSDLDSRGYYSDETRELNNRVNGIIGFLTPILKLKVSDYLTIEFENKEKEREYKQQIFLSKKGFFKQGYSKKSAIYIDSIFGYLNSNELKQKIKNKAKTNEERKKIDDIFEYIKSYEEVRETIKGTFFEKKYNNEINFEGFNFINDDKKTFYLNSIELDTRGIEVGYSYDDGGMKQESFRFSFPSGEEIIKDWNLTYFLSLKNEIFDFLKEAKKELEAKTKKYLENKKRFYEIINPYLMLNTL